MDGAWPQADGGKFGISPAIQTRMPKARSAAQGRSYRPPECPPLRRATSNNIDARGPVLPTVAIRREQSVEKHEAAQRAPAATALIRHRPQPMFSASRGRAPPPRAESP